MGKEPVLPKNIRQIGEIHGREKVCIEDYVMTFIHKKGTKEEQGCLSVFLGEQQSTEEAEYLFIRGILEVPQQNESGETDWNILYEQQKKYFPEWTVQGCCVIGAYPAGRMEKLTEAVPEAAGLLYHLQEQEETLYRMTDGQYRRLPGYFVFYEQNRRMQEYLSALYGEESVEKEGAPDKAIKSFRAKVEEKGLQRNSSFLRLASSFFVITVLVIGAVVVNRIEDIRKVKNTTDIEAVEDGEIVSQAARRIVASGDGTSAANQADAGGSAAAASDGVASDVQQEVEANAGDGAVLSGSDSFWEDTTAELNEIMQSAPGENYVDGDAEVQRGESQAADAASQSVNSQPADMSSQSMDDQAVDTSLQSANDQTAAVPTQDADGQVADAASQSVDSQPADTPTQSADGQSADAASQSVNSQPADTPSQSTDGQAADAASQSVNSLPADTPTPSTDGQSADAASQTAGVSGGVTVGTVTTTDGASPGGADGTQEAVSRQVQATYTIREGDTLADICNKYYGSLDRLKELCDVNAITDANLIMPGQKLVLP